MNSNASLESEGSSTTTYDRLWISFVDRFPIKSSFSFSTAIEHNQLKDEPLSWDQPREIPSHVFNEEEDASNLYSVMKIIKVIVYVLGFAIVLVGASLSQLSFTLIGAQMNLTGEKVSWTILFIFSENQSFCFDSECQDIMEPRRTSNVDNAQTVSFCEMSRKKRCRKTGNCTGHSSCKWFDKDEKSRISLT